MELGTKVACQTEFLKAKEKSSGQTETVMKESGLKIRWKETVLTIFLEYANM
jgi:hypothetical protein